MSVSGGSVDSHMMKLRMKLVQQKIQNEKDKMQRPPSIESNSNEDDLDKQARLQQAMLRRQELLDRIRREQLLNEENKRPRTYSANRRRYTPSPVQPPPSRRSLPEFARMQSMNQYYHQRPDTHRSKPEMSQVKHVIEHKIATPRQQNPYQLPPIQQPGQALQPPAIVQPQQPPQIVSMQQPAPPAIIQGPAPQHIFTTGYQQPVIHNLGAPTQENKPQGMFNKSDFMDMVLLQNAQLHQILVQQSLAGTDYYGVPRINPGGAVHHHHYTSPPPSQPAIHHYTSLPAMDIRGGYPYRADKKKQDSSIAKKPVRNKTKTRSKPRSEAVERFRNVALAALFIAHLRAKLKKNVPNRPNSMFLFGIILKEIVAALHRIYLNPNGNIYPVLIDIIGPNCYDLALLVHGGFKDSKEESVLIQELQYVVENVIYHITEIMPGTGVLGTHRKSAVYELIRNGKRFPEGYFWQCEMDRLQFNENGRTVNIGDVEAFLLMLGIFISRSLVTTILLKPVDYGLSSEPITETAERNLRVVASTILYLVRRIAVARGQGIMDMPAEIAKYLYSDQEMQHVYGKLSRTFNYCEGLLREWGTEYVRRLHASTNAEHQQRYE